MNTFGKNIRISLFGESHGKYIGLVIDGIPSGITLDEKLIKDNLSKRKGNQQISTNRCESDNYEIVSGYFNNHTTGSPLTFLIKNEDARSNDYEEGIVRPNHSDYPAFIKHHGFNDYRGGGHFSGRITALFVIVGSICEQLLAKENIKVYSHITSILDIKSKTYTDGELINKIKMFEKHNFMVDKDQEEKALALIKQVKENNDSLPSKVETLIEGAPVGLGDPFFDSFESTLSHLLFSIPAVKAVSFGDFDLENKLGSNQTDEMEYKDDQVIFSNNHQGGIMGGLTNGNIIKFSTTFKAPSSTMMQKKSINIITKENITVQTPGRHDPIIGIRAIPVINAIAYYTVLELMLENKKYEIIR